MERNKQMDKYEEIKELVSVMSDEQIIEIFIKALGTDYFVSEFYEWLDNCDDEDLEIVSEKVEEVRKATSEKN
jgi:hypothetical protein